MPRSQRPLRRRPLFWVGLALGLVVLVRLVLDPIAAWFLRDRLARLEGYDARFEDVHVTVLPPGVSITRFRLWDEGTSAKRPLFSAERIESGVHWRELLEGHLVGELRLRKPTALLISKQQAKKAAGKRFELSALIEKISPLKIARVEVKDGVIVMRQVREEGDPELRIHDIEAAAENLATRAALAEGEPTTVTARARVQKSGRLTAFLSADPLAKGLTFAGRFELEGLRLAEIREFVVPKTRLEMPRGTLDLFAEFAAKGGKLEGGVKPILKGVEVRAAEPGLWNRIRAGLADKTLDVMSDDVPGRDAVATVIPIRGSVSSPKLQLWPTILGVVRNAFVEGVASGFARLPPPTAPEEPGVIDRLKAALSDDADPPRAEPREGDEQADPAKERAKHERKKQRAREKVED